MPSGLPDFVLLVYCPPLLPPPQDWHIHAVSLPTYRSRTLVPRRGRAERQLEACLMAITAVQGGRGSYVQELLAGVTDGSYCFGLNSLSSCATPPSYCSSSCAAFTP